ncbi:MAG: hypothetical protein KDE27_07885 [Planctomycetes bacterium]|nr:hypothetical protein [Planctomycetota bacterium]
MRSHLPNPVPGGLALFLIAAIGTTQVAPTTDPTPSGTPSDLAALAARVDAAHRPNGPVPAVTAFRAALSIEPLAIEQEQSGQVDLQVNYLRWVRQDERIRHLIRYEVKGAGREIVQGRDRNGFWQLFQGKAQDIPKSDVESREGAERNTMLARQLLRFLDPAAVVRSLQRPGAVATEPFQVGRQAPIECDTVEGTLAGFPLLRLAGADDPVRLKLWVGKADGRLLAVLVRPERDGKPVDREAELIRFADYREQNGVLIPKQLVSSFEDADGQMRPQSRVFLTELDLRPEFTVDDFDRPTS